MLKKKIDVDKVIKEMVDVYNEWHTPPIFGGTGYYAFMRNAVELLKKEFDTWKWPK